MRLIATLLAAASIAVASAQGISPDSCNIAHSDSCWYFTLHYTIDKPHIDGEVFIIPQICNSNTCHTDTAHHFMGRRFAKKYVKLHGTQPRNNEAGYIGTTLYIPEQLISDSVWAITFSQRTTPDGNWAYSDTMLITLPEAIPLCNHRLRSGNATADSLSRLYPGVKNISRYTLATRRAAPPLSDSSMVYFSPSNAVIDKGYRDNSASIDHIAQIINKLKESGEVQAVHVIGFGSPDEGNAGNIGGKRATALCNSLKTECNLPDSVFEAIDGGNNWPLLYNNIASMHSERYDSLLSLLSNEPGERRRLQILRSFDNGAPYRDICRENGDDHRGACTARIYYLNRPDRAVEQLNAIVDELQNNPAPNYSELLARLSAFGNDPRALNIKGVIEYRMHHISAAESAFTQAAMMGNEQAMRNLELLEAAR